MSARPSRHARRRFRRATGLGVVGLLASTALAIAATSSASADTPTQAATESTPAAQGVTAAPASVASEQPAADGELVGLRTETSRTYVGSKGSRVVKVFSTPINAKDSNGKWQPIDETLVASAGGYDSKSTTVAVHLPSDPSTAPVALTSHGQQLSFQLAGAASTSAQVSGSSLTYPGIAPSADARYDVQAAGLKETLLLKSAAAASSYSFSVTLPAGADVTTSSAGDLSVVLNGNPLFTLPAPVAADSASTPSQVQGSYAVSGSGSTRTVTASIPQAWLSDPARAFPVSLDPSVGSTNGIDSYIESGSQANTNFSGATGAKVCAGYDTVNAAPVRTVINYLDDGLPSNVKVISSGVYLHALSATGSQALQMYQETQAFNELQVTWNNAQSGTAWTTAGGVLGAPQDTRTVTGADAAGAYHEWTVDPQIIEAWLQDPSHKFLGWELKAPVETSGNLACLQGAPDTTGMAPYMQIEYVPVDGTPANATTFDHTVDTHEAFHVNIGTGNLVDSSSEFTAASPGVPLTITRTYNSESAGVRPWMIGQGWYLSPGDTAGDPLQDTPGYFAYHSWEMLYGTDGHFLYAHPVSYANLSSGTYAPPPGQNADFAVDGSSNITITDHKSQTVWKYLGSNDHMLDRITDRDGNAETVAYSTDVCTCYGDHFVSSVTDTSGRTYTYAHDGFNRNLTGITGPVVNGAALTTSYIGTSNDLNDAKDTGGFHTLYGYDTSHRMTSITSPQSRKILFTYDSSDRITSVKYVTNPTTGCNVATPSTCTGNTWGFGYTNNTTFGGNGTTVVTDPNGHATTYTWGDQGQVTRTSDALSRNRDTTFTPNGAVATLSDNAATPNVTTLAYDNINNLTSITAPNYSSGHAGYSTSLSYNAPTGVPGDYLPKDSTDPQGNKTTYGYNTHGHLATVTPPTGIGGSALANHYQGDTGYTCGGKTGELCASTDGRGHGTTYSYNAAGLPTTITPQTPLVAKTYTYDNLGEVATATDGKSQKTTYTYDNLGHITKLQFNGTTTCTSGDISAGTCITYGYDNDGNPTTRSSTVGTVTFGYDFAGQLLSKTVPSSTTSAVTYDAAGNVSTYVDAGGTVTYSYNNANDLTGIAEPGGSCTGTISKCTTISYTPDAQRNVITYPSGETVTYTYDNAGRVATITGKRPGGTVFFSRTLNYQTAAPADTNVVQSVVDGPTSVTTTDSYDAYNRLKTSVVGSTTYGYTYDVTGNRLTSAKTGSSTSNFGYNNADQLCESGTSAVATYTTSCTGTPGAGNTQYTYDGNGSQLTGGLAFTYNPKNQTTAAGTVSSAYADSDQAERASSTVSSTTTTLLNGAEGIGGQTVGAGTPIYFTRDPQGNLFGLRTGAGSTFTGSYYLIDQQGSVLRLTDSTGNTDTGTYTYDPYGQLLSHSGTQDTVNPYRYATGYLDSNGLTKLGARYYNATIGRWTQRDSVSFGINDPGELSGYAYVAGNPAINVDPTGGSARCVVASTSAGILGAFIGLGAGPLGASAGAGAAAGATAEACGSSSSSSLSKLGSATIGAVGGAVGGVITDGLGTLGL